MLILPCNAAAYIGNYFRAEVYSKRGWNTWREADANLKDLRIDGLVAFGALDSSTLETNPEDPRGAIVLETEMHRAANPDGEDWGPPSWRWFRPTPAGSWKKLERLTDAITRGVRRVSDMGIQNVFTLVNPRAYFLSLAAAVGESGLLDNWVLFRVPAHPRHLISAVKEVTPFVRSAAEGKEFPGGIYHVPSVFPFLQKEGHIYSHMLPTRWYGYGEIPRFSEIRGKWEILEKNQ